MSSKYDQSGTEPPFLPSQGLPLQSSTPLNKHGRALRSWCFMALLEVSHNSISKSFPEDISFWKFKKKNGHLQNVWFSNSTLSYVGNLFTSRRPRCSKVFFWKVRGKVESSFFILYTQAFYKRPVNLPTGWWALPICQMRYVILPFLSSKIKVYSGTKHNCPKAR